MTAMRLAAVLGLDIWLVLDNDASDSARPGSGSGSRSSQPPSSLAPSSRAGQQSAPNEPPQQATSAKRRVNSAAGLGMALILALRVVITWELVIKPGL